MIFGQAAIRDIGIYASRMKDFKREDWLVYFAWSGMMLGLCFTVFGFVLTGYFNGVQYPAYVWNIPLGTLIFTISISFDTIGHRTVYKQELEKAESLVHHITIFAGVTSCLLLCLAYTWREFFMIPALVMTALSVMYSIIDEWMHWTRFTKGQSDRIEMWAHFGIFLGHNIMMAAWVYWFIVGYPGVAETLPFLAL